MEKEDILRNADTLETAARESIHESNRQIFALSDLVIRIAVGIGGLAATFIVSSKRELLYSRLGLIFIALAILSGAVQMFVDSQFFRDNGRRLISAADRWKIWGISAGDPIAMQDAKNALDELAQMPNSSTYLPLILQAVFVVIGTIFILIDVFTS